MNSQYPTIWSHHVGHDYVQTNCQHQHHLIRCRRESTLRVKNLCEAKALHVPCTDLHVACRNDDMIGP